MRVAAKANVLAPTDQVWSFVSDPERALSFMSGVTRWEVVDERRTGLGARYRVLFRIGAAEIGGLIEVVEWDEPTELAWTSVTGVDQRRPLAFARTVKRPDDDRAPDGIRRGGLRAVGLDRGAGGRSGAVGTSATYAQPAEAPDRAGSVA